MSAVEIVSPVWKIVCDHGDGCARAFIPAEDFYHSSERAARRGAELLGWRIRPWSGRGSRSGPDLCPEHVEPS